MTDVARGRRGDAALLFLVLVAVYHVNSTYLAVNDAIANTALPILILNDQSLSFTSDAFPGMFLWQTGSESEAEYHQFSRWDTLLGDETAAELYEAGALRLVGPMYYLVPTRREGEYANVFGLGSGLTALPVFAALHLALGDLRDYEVLSHHAGKFVAACTVAGSALFVFLIASIYTDRRNALLVGLAYGVGTCVWSTSSQALWQHGPTELYLAMASYAFIRAREGPRFAAACGFAAAMAVLSRPTSAVLVLVLALALLRDGRRALAAFVAAGAPVAVVLSLYNLIYLGAPWHFGQANLESDATFKTGASEIWTFDFFESVPGLLVSPSRGLFVFSPFLLFAVVGLFQAWRQPRYRRLRPFAVAFAATALIQFSWHDWWGGWSYGYRPLVDTTVYLAIFLIPITGWLWQKRMAAAAFAVMLCWSVLVQALGAFSDTLPGWNERTVYRVELPGEPDVRTLYDADETRKLLAVKGAKLVSAGPCDIDLPACHYRLWSIRDSQIVYHLTRYVR